jgi:hypothetical protein
MAWWRLLISIMAIVQIAEPLKQPALFNGISIEHCVGFLEERLEKEINRRFSSPVDLLWFQPADNGYAPA